MRELGAGKIFPCYRKAEKMKNLVIFLLKKGRGVEPINQSFLSIYLPVHLRNPESGGLWPGYQMET